MVYLLELKNCWLSNVERHKERERKKSNADPEISWGFFQESSTATAPVEGISKEKETLRQCLFCVFYSFTFQTTMPNKYMYSLHYGRIFWGGGWGGGLNPPKFSSTPPPLVHFGLPFHASPEASRMASENGILHITCTLSKIVPLLL